MTPAPATTPLFDFNEWQRTQPQDGELEKHKNSRVRGLLMEHRPMPRLVCKDGFNFSVQASSFHYCEPRFSKAHSYASVEVGYPSEKEDALMEWAEDSDNPTSTVYGWVPVEVINAIVAKHGGISSV